MSKPLCPPARRAIASAVILTIGLAAAEASAAFDVVEATIPELRAAYESGETTAVEVVQQYVQRINTYDRSGPRINAVPIISPSLLADAQRVDDAFKAGVNLGPLMGVPILLKDSFNVEGLVATNGVGVLKDLVAPADAFNVKQMREAGAIILGKTNMTTWAHGSPRGIAGESETYGPVLNPYVPDRTPGSSSSGTGAAVNANFAMFGMGGETGGSIRNPAAQNALVGIKPSPGTISGAGTWPLTSDRDVVGPLTRTVTDAAIAMNALVAPDPDNIWNDSPWPNPSLTRPDDYTDFLKTDALVGKKLALPRPYIGQGDPTKGPAFPMQTAVAAAFENARTTLEGLGAELVIVDLPGFEIMNKKLGKDPAYPFPTDTDFSKKTTAFYLEEHIKSYGDPRFQSIQDIVDAIGPDNFYYEEYLEAAGWVASGEAQPWTESEDQKLAFDTYAKIREEGYEDYMRENGIDGLVFPTYPYIAPVQGKAAETTAVFGGLPAALEGNRLGLPAITVPMGYSPEGAPISLEFMGFFGGEADIIGFAYAYEQATQFRVPPDLDALPAVIPLPPAVWGGLATLGIAVMPVLRRARRVA